MVGRIHEGRSTPGCCPALLVPAPSGRGSRGLARGTRVLSTLQSLAPAQGCAHLQSSSSSSRSFLEAWVQAGLSGVFTVHRASRFCFWGKRKLLTVSPRLSHPQQGPETHGFYPIDFIRQCWDRPMLAGSAPLGPATLYVANVSPAGSLLGPVCGLRSSLIPSGRCTTLCTPLKGRGHG